MKNISDKKFIQYVTTLLRVENDRIVDEINVVDGLAIGKYTHPDNNNVVDFEAIILNNIVKIISKADSKFRFSHTIAIQEIKVIARYIKNNTTNIDYENSVKLDINLKTLVDKLNNNEIKFKLHNHFKGLNGKNDWVIERFKKSFIKYYNDTFNNANGANDNKWNSSVGESVDDTNKSMRNFYQLYLDRLITKNYRIFEYSEECECGRKFEFKMLDSNTISIMVSYGDKEDCNWDLSCEYANGIKPYGGIINIESDMILSNYMIPLKKDAPKDKEYTDTYNICKQKGRSNVADWKCKNQNVAYGQMGNMSVTVYVNKQKNHVILTEDLDYVENSEIKLKKIKAMGFKSVGEISLSVWRWEATDMKTLESAFEKMEDKQTDNIFDEFKKNYADIVKIKVKHGKWQFNHYYDSKPNPSDKDGLFIYAELKLIK